MTSTYEIPARLVGYDFGRPDAERCDRRPAWPDDVACGWVPVVDFGAFVERRDVVFATHGEAVAYAAEVVAERRRVAIKTLR